MEVDTTKCQQAQRCKGIKAELYAMLSSVLLSHTYQNEGLLEFMFYY